MMSKLLIGLTVLMAGLGVLLFPAPVGAWRDPSCEFIDQEKDAEAWKAAGCDADSEETLLGKIPAAVLAVFWVAGIIAVGVIVFGGVRYSTSQGDPGKVKKAKDTIMYAVIGMVVTLLAFSFVAFVLENVT